MCHSPHEKYTKILEAFWNDDQNAKKLRNFHERI